MRHPYQTSQVRSDFSPQVSLNFLPALLVFRLEGFCCVCGFHSLHPPFSQVLNDLQPAHFIWRNKGNGSPIFPARPVRRSGEHSFLDLVWNIVVERQVTPVPQRPLPQDVKFPF